jgi:hypothetical protein
MNFTGIAIGLGSFLLIGGLHPLVIRAEYAFGKKIWPLFLVTGLVACGASLFIWHPILSPLLAVLGFALFWSIRELFEQERRVRKGWFPENPARRGE